jgi:peptidase E
MQQLLNLGPGPVYLLADSQLLFATRNSRPLLHAACEAMGEGRALRAAYVGASNGDRPEFFEIFKGAMDLVDVQDRRMVRAAYPDGDRDFLRSADLILLAGGDVAVGLGAMNERAARQDIIDRHRSGAILIGVSAGAVQLGLTHVRPDASPSEQPPDFFGIVPYFVDVHGASSEWRHLRSLVASAQLGVRGLGLAAGGGVIYHQDGSLEPLRRVVAEYWRSEAGLLESILTPSHGSS